MNKIGRTILIVVTALLVMSGVYLLGATHPIAVLSGSVDSQIKISQAEALYYGFGILGVFFTLLTIIVALFKEDIMHWIKRPVIEVKTEPLLEIIDDNSKEKKAKMYFGEVTFVNKSRINASGCELYVQEVAYGKSEKKLKKIRCVQDNGQIGWFGKELLAKDIPSRTSTSVRLFQIKAPVVVSEPGQNGKECLYINFFGVNLPADQSKAGVWRVKYYLKINQGIEFSFEILVEWDGKWQGRAVDMSLTIENK